MICTVCNDKCRCEDSEYTKEIRKILEGIDLSGHFDQKEEDSLRKIINNYGRKRLKETIINLACELKKVKYGAIVPLDGAISILIRNRSDDFCENERLNHCIGELKDTYSKNKLKDYIKGV